MVSGMSAHEFLTITQQVVQLLREEIYQGTLSGTMPGRNQVAARLGINCKTVEEAMRLLEKEGLLVSQGAGRNRRIVPPTGGIKPAGLRVGLLLWGTSDRSWSFVMELQHQLAMAGHQVIPTRKTLTELKMDVGRVARMVEETQADAWIVLSGSLEVLQWFAGQQFPTLAIFGRSAGLPISKVGQGRPQSMVQATQTLIGLGHRRIVLLIRRQHRLPEPSLGVRAFLSTLEAHGMKTSGFTMPDWEESHAGFQECLKALFQVTPPTALMVDEASLFTATCHFLAARGLRVPQDVSLICWEADANFEWCVPTIAHIRTDMTKVVHHVMRWTANVSAGKRDVREAVINVNYVPGDTVGPAPKKMQYEQS